MDYKSYTKKSMKNALGQVSSTKEGGMSKITFDTLYLRRIGVTGQNSLFWRDVSIALQDRAKRSK